MISPMKDTDGFQGRNDHSVSIFKLSTPPESELDSLKDIRWSRLPRNERTRRINSWPVDSPSYLLFLLHQWHTPIHVPYTAPIVVPCQAARAGTIKRIKCDRGIAYWQWGPALRGFLGARAPSRFIKRVLTRSVDVHKGRCGRRHTYRGPSARWGNGHHAVKWRKLRSIWTDCMNFHACFEAYSLANIEFFLFQSLW
jgi:hypothetical protein